jgi:serine/threonine protein kinase
MLRSLAKLSAEDSLISGSRRGLDVDVPTDRADAAVAALRQLIGSFPDHPAILPITGAGVAAGRPFVVTPPCGGEPLDRALLQYGPAELGDVLPRLQMLADALDLAAAHGICHGALQPRNILVSPEDTRLHGLGVVDRLSNSGVDVPALKPYSAPEVRESGDRSPASDQFAFAAITYEWLFGRPLAMGADSVMDVPALPDVRRDELTRAFMRALATSPSDRFANCAAFVSAIGQSRGRARLPQAVSPPELNELPLNRDVVAEAPEEPAPLIEPVPARSRVPMAVTAVLIGGAAVGVLGVWVAMRPHEAPRASQAGQGQPFTDAPVSPAAVSAPSEEIPPAPSATPPPPSNPPAGADVVRAANVDAGLLVHSVPEGAMVTIDGVEHGRTPIAIRGLPLGTRTVLVGHPGYRSAERRVVLTADRPSRTLEMQLVSAARPVPATPSARAASEGRLLVDSRPAGASVLIDGRPAGVTPLTVTGIAPGSYSVRIERAGYRVVTTSVDVRAGERARVAARLEGGR